MIRLSRLTDYGIVLMAHLAGCDDGEPHNAREAAAATDLPLPVVSKILKALARQQLLVSHRGAKGGYGLARTPEQISVAEMISALEGPVGLTECTVHPGQCNQEASCHVREPWQQINQVVRSALEGITLADLATPSGPGSVVPLEQLGVDPHGLTQG